MKKKQPITEELIQKSWVDYRKWYEKRIGQGIRLTDDAEVFHDSYQMYKLRYNDLKEEGKVGFLQNEGEPQKSIFSEIKSRSYAIGTKKQYYAALDAMKRQVKAIREKDPTFDFGIDVDADSTYADALKTNFGALQMLEKMSQWKKQVGIAYMILSD